MVFGRKKEAPAPPPPPAPQRNPRQTMREQTRQNDRQINKVQREMARERIRLENEEKKIMTQMKMLGKQGRVGEARMLAKNLVQVRNAKNRTYQASVQAGAIGTQARMAQTDAAMMNVMGTTAEVMKNANGMTNPEQAMKMLQEYDMQSEKMKLQQEMTDEVLDSTLGGAEFDDETDDVLNSVLDEIGLEVSGQMGAAPKIQPAALPEQERLQAADDEELRRRIEGLGGARQI